MSYFKISFLLGISKILRDAMEEVKEGNFSIRQKLLKISSKFVNGVEVSAQEAAYSLLGLHMSEASVGCIFINTFPPEQRVQMLKSQNELKKLDPLSRNVFRDNVITYYQNRPKSLGACCFAELCALYEKLSSKTHFNSEKYVKLENEKGFLRKRTTPKIIRYRMYRETEDPENYYRENIMLFLPWFNEEKDILAIDCEMKFKRNSKLIEMNRRKFFKFEDQLHELESLEVEFEEEDNLSNESNDPDFECFNLRTFDHDLSLDLPTLNTEPISNIKITSKALPKEELNQLIANLNVKQRQYWAHAMHRITNECETYEIVTGKNSVLILM